MNTDSFFSIAFLLFSISVIIAVVIMIILVVLGLVCSYIYEISYKKAVINIILSNLTKQDQNLLQSIRTEYTNYRSTKINAFSYLSIERINSTLTSELRNDKYKRYYTSQIINANDIANKLERVNQLIIEEQSFNPDEISKIVNDIQALSVTKGEEKKVSDLIARIKIRFFSCLAYCDGRIYEKDITIYNLEHELKKNRINKFLCWLGWIIGVISGIITICLWLKG